MNRKACWSKMANTALILCSKSQDMEEKKIPLANQDFNKGLVLPQQEAVTSILKTDTLGNCHFF